MDSIDSLKNSFWSGISKLVGSVPVPAAPEATPASPVMNFPVGQGLNDRQTKVADATIGKTDSALNEAQGNSFWGQVKSTAENVFSRQPATEIRRPFETTPIDTTLPPIVTEPARQGFQLIEAIPRFVATVGGEVASGFGQRGDGTVKSNIDLRRFGFETPDYVSASKEVTDAINNGENPWQAGLRVVSHKALDVSFGAQLTSELAGMTTSMLLRGGPEARIEAQNVVDAMKVNQKAAFERLKDAPLDVRERTMADLVNTKNQAEAVLREQGSPTALDYARSSASRYTDLLARQTNVGKDFWSRFSGADLGIRPPTIGGVPLDVPQLPGTRERPGQAPAFGLSTQEMENVGYGDHLEGINPDQKTRLTESQAAPLADKAAQIYWDQKIATAKDAGLAQVIGADDLKDHFNRDYNSNNHPIYSQAANKIYERAVTEDPGSTVKLTVGGPGSGKSDFLVPNLSDNYRGVIYDSTGWNYEGIKRQVDFAQAHGKVPEVYAILPDLARSRAYTFLREQSGQHPVSEAAFIRNHTGAIDTLIKLINDGVEVNVLDTRKVHNLADAVPGKFEYLQDPIELLKELKYNEENVKQAISKVTKENAQEIIDKAKAESRGLPQENRPDQGLTKSQQVEAALERAKNFKPGESFGLRNRDLVKTDFARTVQKPVTIKPRTPIQDKLTITRNALEEVDQKLGSPKEGPVDFNGNTLAELRNKQITLEVTRETIENNRAKSLTRYEAQSGPYKGELPEALGKSIGDLRDSNFYKGYRDPNVLKFIKEGDQISQEAGFADSEEARQAYTQYKEGEQQYKSILKNFTKEVRDYTNFVKQDLASLSKMATQRVISLEDLEPPTVRGDIKAPRLDFGKWKDKPIFFLNRDTFERNLEKIAPASDAQALQKFLVDPVRENELARIKFTNGLKETFQKKLTDLGIKRNSEADGLIQKFGERQISLDELKKASPKQWEQIQSASNLFRDTYDMLLNRWNAERSSFNFTQIPKVANYFRHFDEINFFVQNYGFLRSQDELPAEIAGKTEFFKPGKPFTTAELRRTGNSTKYSAVGGFNNYIESVTKQIYHIDSVQRGRALEKYMENAAKLSRSLGSPLQLSNVIANFREYVNNGLAQKTATLDRSIENTIGRPTIRGFQTVSRLIGKNIIVGNISTALSHLVSIPLIASTTDKIPLIQSAMTTMTSPLTKDGFTTVNGQESSFLTRRYPKEEIMPTMPKTAENALSYLFQVTDKFKSRLAVGAKYYEGIKSGLDPKAAMREADIYAGKLLGDYSFGQKPNLMNAKTTTLLAQFQLGLNDSMSVLMHDIPHGSESKWGVTSKLIQFAVFSYLFNEVVKNIRGAGKGIDPIDLGMTLMGVNDQSYGASFPKRLGLAAKDLAGELPFSSAVTGNFPLATALSQPVKDLLAGNYAKMAEGVAANFASPIGGGLQAKKTIEGVNSIRKGGVFGPSGQFEFKQDSGTFAKIQSAVFGKYASQHAQDFFNKTAIASKDQAPIKKVFDQVQQLKAAGKTDEAQKLVDGLSDKDYNTYKTIRSNELRKNTLLAEEKMASTVRKVHDLKESGKTDEAQSVVNDMTDEEYHIYQLTRKKVYGE